MNRQQMKNLIKRCQDPVGYKAWTIRSHEPTKTIALIPNALSKIPMQVYQLQVVTERSWESREVFKLLSPKDYISIWVDYLKQTWQSDVK